MKTCPFCNLKDRPYLENSLAYVVWDLFPVSKGHSLVIPKRHFDSYFDATSEEIQAIHSLMLKTRTIIDDKYHPDAYNIGVNVGQYAGQSVFHLHVHLVPRYINDHPRPKGGVRNIIPGRGHYK